MASVTVHCPRCQSAQVYRHGQNPKGRDRFRCCEPAFSGSVMDFTSRIMG
ncbi:IS1 InsA protein [Escherichia coli]|nr:IS1 InsA protein [Escherichia coli]SVF55220.1 IS1 InsA protein [Escherichia coli]